MAEVARQAFQLLLMSAAAFRLWRLAGYDDITEPLREPLENSDRPWVRKLHEGLTCPWCAGSWLAFATVALTRRNADVEHPVLQALAAAALVGWIHERVG